MSKEDTKQAQDPLGRAGYRPTCATRASSLLSTACLSSAAKNWPSAARCLAANAPALIVLLTDSSKGDCEKVGGGPTREHVSQKLSC
jgi:hypothetical protein